MKVIASGVAFLDGEGMEVGDIPGIFQVLEGINYETPLILVSADVLRFHFYSFQL